MSDIRRKKTVKYLRGYLTVFVYTSMITGRIMGLRLVCLYR